MKNENENENKKDITLGEAFEKVTKIKNNEFIETSLDHMYKKYNLNTEIFFKGIEKLKKSLHKLNTYDDCMRYLSGIYKIDSERNKKIEFGD